MADLPHYQMYVNGAWRDAAERSRCASPATGACVPDPEMGEQVKAVVELAPGVPTSDELAQDLIEYTQSRIAHYKAPRSVALVDELPRAPTGMLVKGLLR